MSTSKRIWFTVHDQIINRFKDEMGNSVVRMALSDDVNAVVHKSVLFDENPASIIERQARRIAELEGALKPFAEACKRCSKAKDYDDVPDDHAIDIWTGLVLGDLRRAAKVLGNADARGGEKP
jgi:hypothetical protein